MITNVIKPLAKGVLIPLVLTASREDSGLLLKGVSETIQNKSKEQIGGFLSMLLCTLVESLLGNILAGKEINKAGEGAIAKRQGRGIVRAGYGNKKVWKTKKKQKEFLMPPHLLTNFEIQKYYQNQTRFNGVYSRDNLPKAKDGVFLINLDEYSDIGTRWIALYVLNNDVTYFDSFGVEHFPKEIKAFIGNKNIKINIFRVQAYDSIMSRYFCIGFIDFKLAGKTSADFTNLQRITLKKMMM